MPVSTSLRLLALALLAGTASAQTQPRAVVEVGAVLQEYTAGTQDIRELTIPLRASVVAAPGLELSVRTAHGSVSGEGLESIRGLADTQLGANVRRPVGGGIVDLGLTVSLPTGQTALSPDQFATATALALDDYAFALPSFGRGLVLAPGLAIAIPAGDALAIGLGASHSLASDFTPFADDTSAYAPADETILTAGLDASLGGASRFTLEGSYVLYGDDAYQGETFSPGNKLGGRMRLALGSGPVRWSLLARYRQVGDGAIGTPVRPVAYLRPTQGQLALGLAVVQTGFEVGLTSGLRYYGSLSDAVDAPDFESSLTGQQVLLDIGVSPSAQLGAAARLVSSFTYTLDVGSAAGTSSFSGYRAGVGVRVGL